MGQLAGSEAVHQNADAADLAAIEGRQELQAPAGFALGGRAVSQK